MQNLGMIIIYFSIKFDMLRSGDSLVIAFDQKAK
jgi:hypothetical protein